MDVPKRVSAADARPRRFRPAQWSIFEFRFVPLLVFAAGCWAAFYGVMRHRIPVTETREEEHSVPVSVQMPDLSAFVPGLPPPPPVVKYVKRIETIKTVTGETEMAVNRDVSFGRLTRTGGGEIARSGGGKAGPAFCPT